MYTYTHEGVSMKQILTVMNLKGGVGKTTTASALGACLIKKGHTVLFVDLDMQCNLSLSMGAVGKMKTSMEVLTKTCTAEEAIVKTEQGDIIPASPSLGCAEQTLNNRIYRLKEALAAVADKYDYIILDTPPQTSVLTFNALTASTALLVPVKADSFSVQGIGYLYTDVIKEVQDNMNSQLKILGMVLTMYNSRTKVSKEMKAQLEAVAKLMQTSVLKSHIRVCNALTDAAAKQQSILQFDAKSNAAADYMALCEEVLEV